MHCAIIILEAILIASSLSIDAFIASFAYGTEKIKIPFTSILIITIICSTILGLTFLFGNLIMPYLPDWLATAICFTILFVLGIINLLDSITKSIIKKYTNFNKEIKFSLFNFKFILHLYAEHKDADIDDSKTISSVEAASLAIALSLDGFAVGFGAAMGNVRGDAIFFASLFTNIIAILLGFYLGNKIAKKIKFNLSWISGIIFIILAILKLF